MFKKYSFPILLLLVVGYFGGKYLYMMPKFSDGEVAPLFEAQLISGEQFKLTDLKGKYVLLDFWGTWCGPCRAEIPKVKSLYDKYHSRGLEVVSIALEGERSEKRWRKAVESLGLKWKYHIFDPVTSFKLLDAEISSKTYGVKEVPTKYLLNDQGQIIGVNLPFAEMEKILNQRL